MPATGGLSPMITMLMLISAGHEQFTNIRIRRMVMVMVRMGMMVVRMMMMMRMHNDAMLLMPAEPVDHEYPEK